LHRFDTIQQCERQTDGQTDAQAMAKTRVTECSLNNGVAGSDFKPITARGAG